jgi:uncharacterized phosphosugar-binding protein
MSVNGAAVFAEIRSTLDRIEAGQVEPVAAAADLIADSIAAGGVLHVFGTGHSEALAMELSGRAGGLIPTNKLALRDAVLLGDLPAAALADPKAERDPELSRKVWELAPIRPGDVVLIASQSGGNGSTVEMALIAKNAGHAVIALTSLEHSIASAAIAQALVAEVTSRLIERGVEPPIYRSANVEGGDVHNDAWEARYAGRIRRSAY